MKFTKKANSNYLNKISKTFPVTNSQTFQNKVASFQKKFSNLNISSAEWLKSILNEGRIMRVKWKDAQSTGGPGWEDAEDIKEAASAEICIVNTIGYVINFTEDRIVLTDTIQHDGQAGGAVHLIPIEMVQEIHYLKEDSDVQTHNNDQFGAHNGGAS